MNTFTTDHEPPDTTRPDDADDDLIECPTCEGSGTMDLGDDDAICSTCDGCGEIESWRGGDPAEDFEPDISDEGFDPFLNSYTDDC